MVFNFSIFMVKNISIEQQFRAAFANVCDFQPEITPQGGVQSALLNVYENYFEAKNDSIRRSVLICYKVCSLLSYITAKYLSHIRKLIITFIYPPQIINLLV